MIEATVVAFDAGQYVTKKTFVFNNIVKFTVPPAKPTLKSFDLTKQTSLAQDLMRFRLAPAITTALAAGDRVQLPGFGTFEVRSRAARSGRNPQTGEPMKIAASNAPAFKPALALKNAVNLR